MMMIIIIIIFKGAVQIKCNIIIPIYYVCKNSITDLNDNYYLSVKATLNMYVFMMMIMMMMMMIITIINISNKAPLLAGTI